VSSFGDLWLPSLNLTRSRKFCGFHQGTHNIGVRSGISREFAEDLPRKTCKNKCIVNKAGTSARTEGTTDGNQAQASE